MDIMIAVAMVLLVGTMLYGAAKSVWLPWYIVVTGILMVLLGLRV